MTTTATMATTTAMSEASSGPSSSRSDVVSVNNGDVDLLFASQHSRNVGPTPLSSVHGNLMRSRQRQDPMKYVCVCVYYCVFCVLF